MIQTIRSLPFFDRINAILGAFVACLSYVFGEHWFLFAAYLVLNIIDYITGCMKARINNKINSSKGLSGILKKFGYWLMILTGFCAGAVFIEIGEIININLQVTTLIGWFVLASLIINEFRSIIENFIEAGYNVPKVFSEGLEVASKIIEKIEHSKDSIDKD